MAFLDDLQKRVAGQPVESQVAGAPPMPTPNQSFANPPAAATATQGRPTNGPPPFPGAAGPSLPVTPPAGVAAQQPATGSSTGTGGGTTVTVKTGAGGEQQSQQQQPQQPAQEPVFNVAQIPSAADMATMPPGMKIMSPYGEVNRDGTIQLSPEGADAYRTATVHLEKRFGPHPWAGDVNAPRPKVRLGRSNFNPFTGQWITG